MYNLCDIKYNLSIYVETYILKFKVQKSSVYSEDNESSQLKARIILAFEKLETEITLKNMHENLIRIAHLCIQHGG